MVERLICNEDVEGSSPFSSFMKKVMNVKQMNVELDKLEVLFNEYKKRGKSHVTMDELVDFDKRLNGVRYSQEALSARLKAKASRKKAA